MQLVRKRSITVVFGLLAGILFASFAFLNLVKANEPIVTVVPAAKVAYGVVETRGGQPVQQAMVIAYQINRPHRVSTLTDADGTYKLELGPGLWSLTVKPTDGSDPAGWVYPREPQTVEFEHNNLPEQQEVNFVVVRATAVVEGKIELPDGSVPPFTVVVGFRNGEGMGVRTTISNSTGEFRVKLPAGRYDVIIHPQNDGFAGPQVEPILLAPGETLKLGTLTLLARTSIISGRLVDQDGNGVPNVPVIAWQNQRADMYSTRSGPDGRYALKVFTGTWHVTPAPRPDQPYFYQGDGKVVRIGPGETIKDVDFRLLAADAKISGVLVDEDGQPVEDVYGWAMAVSLTDPAFRSGAPIRDGKFGIHVVAGRYEVTVDLAPGSMYTALDPVIVAVESGQTAEIRVPVRKIDGAIQGPLIDPRQNRQPVTGVPGRVTAWNGDRWASTGIKPETGTYSMRVAAGLWHTNYTIASDDYVKLRGPANIPVESGKISTWPLLVTEKDAGLSGKVLTPDGGPFAGAVVVIQGLTGEVKHLRLHATTDEEGGFRIAVPYGRYRVLAPGGRPGWINPVDLLVNVRPNEVVEGLVLKFREPNAAIVGRLAVESGEAGSALVWTWTERGGFNYGRFPLELIDDQQAVGEYRLGVISGTSWHVGAIFETETQFWGVRTVVDVQEEEVIQNLVLDGPFPKPPPVAVTFPADEAQRLNLGDGTHIFIPAGAMPTEGMVTLRIVPVAALPQQHHARIIRYGYAFFASDESGRPIEEQFNHNVLIRFKYDPPAVGLQPWDVKPAYFSTTTNEWTVPESYVVDPQRGLVKMEIDHFTNFALLEGSANQEMFLPMVER